MGLVRGVYQQAILEGAGKNHTFVGSYKLPLAQYTCIGQVAAQCYVGSVSSNVHPQGLEPPGGVEPWSYPCWNLQATTRRSAQ